MVFLCFRSKARRIFFGWKIDFHLYRKKEIQLTCTIFHSFFLLFTSLPPLYPTSLFPTLPHSTTLKFTYRKRNSTIAHLLHPVLLHFFFPSASTAVAPSLRRCLLLFSSCSSPSLLRCLFLFSSSPSPSLRRCLLLLLSSSPSPSSTSTGIAFVHFVAARAKSPSLDFLETSRSRVPPQWNPALYQQ